MQLALIVALLTIPVAACSAGPRVWPMDGPLRRGTISLDGADLSFVVDGGGAPCIMVGSALLGHRIFEGPLERHLRCVLLDARAFVATATSDSAYDIPRVVDDLERSRQVLGLERFVLMGHSIWGLVAIEYARVYPQHVSHVVLIGTPPIGTSRLGEAGEAAWNARAEPDRRAALAENTARLGERITTLSPNEAFIATYHASAPKYWYDYDYADAWLWDGVQLNMKLTTELLGTTFGEYDLSSREPSVRAPVFVAVGRHDYVVPIELWTTERRNIADRFVVFEKSGHTPILEEPERFASELASWLAESR